MRAHHVRALLMAGQAWEFYGAAELSRDTDFAILTDADNLSRLRKALAELRVEPIAVPLFELKFLKRGHAIHFRCQHPEAPRMRVNVMSKMRAVDSFAKLWKRRTTIELPNGTRCDLLSGPDLVQAKSTQRDKEWPMMRRLKEADYFQDNTKPGATRIKCWLTELRTPQRLFEDARTHPGLASRPASKRPTLTRAAAGQLSQLGHTLSAEESRLRAEGKASWSPLFKELERLGRKK